MFAIYNSLLKYKPNDMIINIVYAGIRLLSLNNVTYITENGSYILPNGAIIIAETEWIVL